MDEPRPPNSNPDALRLALLFGAMYFVQGICEPTEGLIMQPVRSLMKSWGHTVEEMGRFAFLLGLPWSIKPLYGLLTDFVPIRGSRRRSYLILTCIATSVPLLYLYAFPPQKGDSWLLLAVLMLPTVNVAFSDVVIDALMVETGQPRGLTGRLQSVQWAAIYGAPILTGYVGGLLSEYGYQTVGFLICGGVALLSLAVVLFFVREPEATQADGGLRKAVGLMWTTMQSSGLWVAGAFLFLWNFNPFSSAVLYMHMTEVLGMSEEFYGWTLSLQAMAAVVASVAYGLYCRRIPFRVLVHLSIVAGILNTLAYWALAGERSAQLVSLGVGFFYMTGTLVQLDLAARICLPATAGTTFALLMSLTNFSYGLGAWLGSSFYKDWSERWGTDMAFDVLVAVGAAFTAACWLVVPFLPRQYEESGEPRSGGRGWSD